MTVSSIDINAMPVFRGSKNLQMILQAHYFNIVKRIPWKFRVKLVNIIRKLLISY